MTSVSPLCSETLSSPFLILPSGLHLHFLPAPGFPGPLGCWCEFYPQLLCQLPAICFPISNFPTPLLMQSGVKVQVERPRGLCSQEGGGGGVQLTACGGRRSWRRKHQATWGDKELVYPKVGGGGGRGKTSVNCHPLWRAAWALKAGKSFLFPLSTRQPAVECAEGLPAPHLFGVSCHFLCT